MEVVRDGAGRLACFAISTRQDTKGLMFLAPLATATTSTVSVLSYQHQATYTGEVLNP